MSCRLIPYAANNTDDVEPILNINIENGFELRGKLMIDLECTPSNDSKTYKHVFTMVSNRFHVAAKFRIEEHLVISLKNIQLDLNIDSIQNSAIGDVDVTL